MLPTSSNIYGKNRHSVRELRQSSVKHIPKPKVSFFNDRGPKSFTAEASSCNTSRPTSINETRPEQYSTNKIVSPLQSPKNIPKEDGVQQGANAIPNSPTRKEYPLDAFSNKIMQESDENSIIRSPRLTTHYQYQGSEEKNEQEKSSSNYQNSVNSSVLVKTSVINLTTSSFQEGDSRCNDFENSEVESQRTSVERFSHISTASARSKLINGEQRKKKKLIEREPRSKSESLDIFESIKHLSDTILHNIKRTFTRSNGSDMRKKCECDSHNQSIEGSCSKALKWISKKYKLEDMAYLKSTYDKLQTIQIEEAEASQISKDVVRTFPTEAYFTLEEPGAIELEKVLRTISVYDPEVGYVQGMNFIAAVFVYHAEEYIAFWLLAMVFEIFEMRDIYMPKLPGLSKHCQIIDFLILSQMPDLYGHFTYCSGWLFSLFGMLIPLPELTLFYDNLLEQGWPYFYKLVLAFLEESEAALLEEDMAGILMALNDSNSRENKSKVNWRDLILNAGDIKIDEIFISQMLSNFDQDEERFSLKIERK